MEKDVLTFFLEKPTAARFAKLYNETERFVRAVALRVTRNMTLADDVTGDVYLKVLKRRWNPALVPETKWFLSALTLSVARTLLRAEARRSRREAPRGRLEDLPARETLSPEDLALVHDAMAELPPALRVPLELKYFADLKTQEIAERLRLSPRAVQHRVTLACEALRRRLKSSFGAFLLPHLSGQLERLVRSIAPSTGLPEPLLDRAAEHLPSARGRLRPRRLVRAPSPKPLLIGGVAAAILFGLLFLAPLASRNAPAVNAPGAVAESGENPGPAAVAAALPRVEAPAKGPLKVAPEAPLSQKAAPRAEVERKPAAKPAPEETEGTSSSRAGGLLKISVVDEEGKAVEDGLVMVRKLGGPDDRNGEPFRLFLSYSLGGKNPMLRPIFGRLGEEFQVMVEGNGYPIQPPERFVLREVTELRIVLCSQPVTRVEIRDAVTGERVRRGLVTAAPRTFWRERARHHGARELGRGLSPEGSCGRSLDTACRRQWLPRARARG